MSRSTLNSMDAAFFASDTPAASSGPASQPNSSISSQHTFPTTSSSVLNSAQLLPDFLATVVQAVKAAFSAEQAPVVHFDIEVFSLEDNAQRSVANSESSALVDAHGLNH